MKQLKISLVCLLLISAVSGQQWRITLTSGVVYPSVYMDRLVDQTLYLFHYPAYGYYNRSQPASVAAIAHIEPNLHRIKHLTIGSVVGGAIGFAMSMWLVYDFTHATPHTEAEKRALPAIALGSIVTSSTLGIRAGLEISREAAYHTFHPSDGSAEKKQRSYDLSRMTIQEKVRTVAAILDKH